MINCDFIPLARPFIGDDEIYEVIKVLQSGNLTTGPVVTQFENELANYLQNGKPLGVACLNSCTAALFLTLKAHGIGKGDEVIVPTWTFAATAQVVEWLGATPVLCDIDSESLTISPEETQKLITSRTRAIIPVHFAGYPYNIDSINAISKPKGIKVIEDAAHAIGSKYRGIKIGNFSDATCFSFYATKNLAMGEGGAVVSKDIDFIEYIKKISYFGINKAAHNRYTEHGAWAYDIEELGYKYNLDNIHAAIGLAQLKKLEEMNQKRRAIAKTYKQYLNHSITFTKDCDKHHHIYHLFPIILPEGVNRNKFIDLLRENNIGTSVHFIPLHKHSFYKKRFNDLEFPVADSIFNRIVSIPLFPTMTENEINHVIETINNF